MNGLNFHLHKLNQTHHQSIQTRADRRLRRTKNPNIFKRPQFPAEHRQLQNVEISWQTADPLPSSTLPSPAIKKEEITPRKEAKEKQNRKKKAPHRSTYSGPRRLIFFLNKKKKPTIYFVLKVFFLVFEIVRTCFFPGKTPSKAITTTHRPQTKANQTPTICPVKENKWYCFL